MATIFITGGTGYMGRKLIPELLHHGHRIRALARPALDGTCPEQRLPPGCEVVPGDALDASSYAARVAGADTFVHLIGVPHPSPAKADQFRRVDLVSIHAAVAAATSAGTAHFIYVSVAHPAPVMKAYIEVRAAGEEMIRQAGFNATILRPWYVLGPGHRWPLMLLPAYWLVEQIPPAREGARRLGLVSLEQMVRALANAVDNPARGVRVLEVPQIRAFNGSGA